MPKAVTHTYYTNTTIISHSQCHHHIQKNKNNNSIKEFLEKILAYIRIKKKEGCEQGED